MAETTQPRAGHPRFHQIVGEIQDLHDRKNRDYTGGDASRPLGNFERVAAWMRMYPKMNWATPANVAMVYAMKQLDAALVLREACTDSVTGEDVVDRLRDVAVYSIIGAVIEETAPRSDEPVVETPRERLSGQAWADAMNARQEERQNVGAVAHVDVVDGVLYPGEPDDKKVREVWASRYGFDDLPFVERDAGMSYDDLMAHSKRLFDGRYPTQLTVGEFRRLVKTAGVW